jgi:prepilin-type N-terminal cleavage/methylation domain-containing protein
VIRHEKSVFRLPMRSPTISVRSGHQRGFTLAELAIVITILGLLLVGVLKGQSLIGGARAKDVVAIVGDLRTATASFKDRYKYLPGDWPFSAGEISGVTAGASVGTAGNGIVEGVISAAGKAEADSEVALLPWQLYSAGYLSKINRSDPLNLIATSFGPVHVVSKATAETLVSGFAAANPAARNAIIFSALPCELAGEVDASIDDGNAASGRALGAACTSGTITWYAVAL